MPSFSFGRACVALFVVAAGACSDATAPSRVMDVQTALSEMSIGSYLPATAGAGGPIFTRGSLNPASCAYDGSLQSFVCAPVTTNGLTFTNSYVLLSASGTPLAAYDAATTAAIRRTSTVTGALDLGGFPLQIEEREVMTVSGLLTGTHVLDGTSVGRHTVTFGTQSSIATDTLSVMGLVLPEQAGPDAYPRAGTISLTIVDPAFKDVSPSTSTITLKFNGTSKVDVTMTGVGPAQHCVIDLAARGRGFPGCPFTP